MVVVRVLTQKEFGYYSSANNIISFALLITGAGLLSGVLQYGAEQRPEEIKNQYYKYCLVGGICFDILLTAAVILYSACGLAPIKESTKYILLLSPIIILGYIFDYFCTVLRSQKELVKYSRLLNINTILTSVLMCLGALANGVVGIILARWFAYIISIAIGIKLLRNRTSQIIKAGQLTRKQKFEILKFSLFCCFISALNRILYVIDITIISYIIKDPVQVALYKTGVTIPEALDFIPTSVIVTVLPYFVEHNQDKRWLKKWTGRLFLYSGIVNAILSTILFITAPFFVKLLWGNRYLESVSIFRILTVNYFVMATFRMTGTNILSALRKVNYNLFASVLTAIADIVLDIYLVINYGINGAALATLFSAIFASVMSTPYLLQVIYKKSKI